MKILVYGLDGGDLEVMKTFDMPFFKEFLANNSNVLLTEDLYNRGWVEILTGQEGKNTRGFYMAPMLDGTHRCSTSFKMSELENDPDIVPLWKLAEEKGASYCIMNVPTTTPVPKTKNGIVVGSAGGGLNKINGIPSSLASDEETRKFLEDNQYIVDIRIPNDEIERTEELFENLSKKESKRTDCFIRLCKKKNPDFGFLVNRGNTIVQYLARSEIESYSALTEMREFMPSVAQKSWVHTYLERHYTELDEHIRKLYTELKPDHFIITADHNIVPHKYRVNIQPFLMKNGWLKQNKNSSLLSTIKVIVRKLNLLSTSSKVAKKLSPTMRDSLKGYSWKKSIAFGSEYVPGVFINDYQRFGGPVHGQDEINEWVDKICKVFNAIPSDERGGMEAVSYRAHHLDGKYSDSLPDIKFNGSDTGIYFDENTSQLIRPNKNYGPVPKDLRLVDTNPFTGEKGPNPICVMTNDTSDYIRADDRKNLTLVYKLVERILES